MANQHGVNTRQAGTEPKQRNERRDVEGLLQTLGLRATHIVSNPDPNAVPDVFVDVRMGGKPETSHVGIEVTRYFSDATGPKGSLGREMNEFWAKVWNEIRRLSDRASGLSEVYAYVRLNKDELAESLRGEKPNVSPKVLAKEIGECVAERLMIPDWTEWSISTFDDYPLMGEYVQGITITNHCPASWDANVNVGHVGVSPDRLAEAVEKKNEKVKDCGKARFDELWLLIAGASDTVFNHMPQCPGIMDFGNAELIEACKAGPFDKVFFWSSASETWVRQIWPPDGQDG
jgi:hypothetical protein